MLDPQLRWALAYVAPYWRRLLLVVGLSLTSTLVSLAVPLLSRRLVDDALLGGDRGQLLQVVAIFVGLTAAGFILNVVAGLRYTRVSADILFDMRLDVYRHLQRLSPRFYARTKLGDIVSRLNSDVGEVQRVAAEAALSWGGNVLFLVGTIVMMVWLDLRLFLVGMAVVPFSLWALVHYRRRLERHVAVFRQRSADIGSFLIETLQAVRLVATATAEPREVERFRTRNQAFIGALMSMQLVTYVAGGAPGLLLSAGAATAFLYGGFRYLDGSLTMGTLVAFMAYHMRMLTPLQALMGLYAGLATARVSLARVREIAAAPLDVVDDPTAVAPSEVHGAIVFDDVDVTSERGVTILDGVSFAVAPGETVAIVGPSGVGKSTLADLLVRLIDPDRGTVRLDGHDLRTLPLAFVRQQVTTVEQAPVVFHASILDNLRYARPDASRAAVTTAARAAGLDAFIARLPHGYDTMVGERGAALSAGERQRLAVARALVTDPTVLVLDEATAALDPVTERRVADGYAARARRRTTLVITHRYALARRADRVVVLDGARVVEQGPPDTLRATGGAFARLFGAADDRDHAMTADRRRPSEMT